MNGGKVVLKGVGRRGRLGLPVQFNASCFCGDEILKCHVGLNVPDSSAGLRLPQPQLTNYCAILDNIKHSQYTLFKRSVQTDMCKIRLVWSMVKRKPLK